MLLKPVCPEERSMTLSVIDHSRRKKREHFRHCYWRSSCFELLFLRHHTRDANGKMAPGVAEGKMRHSMILWTAGVLRRLTWLV